VLEFDDGPSGQRVGCVVVASADGAGVILHPSDAPTNVVEADAEFLARVVATPNTKCRVRDGEGALDGVLLFSSKALRDCVVSASDRCSAMLKRAWGVYSGDEAAALARVQPHTHVYELEVVELGVLTHPHNSRASAEVVHRVRTPIVTVFADATLFFERLGCGGGVCWDDGDDDDKENEQPKRTKYEQQTNKRTHAIEWTFLGYGVRAVVREDQAEDWDPNGLSARRARNGMTPAFSDSDPCSRAARENWTTDVSAGWLVRSFRSVPATPAELARLSDVAALKRAYRVRHFFRHRRETILSVLASDAAFCDPYEASDWEFIARARAQCEWFVDANKGARKYKINVGQGETIIRDLLAIILHYTRASDEPEFAVVESGTEDPDARRARMVAAVNWSAVNFRDPGAAIAGRTSRVGKGLRKNAMWDIVQRTHRVVERAFRAWA